MSQQSCGKQASASDVTSWEEKVGNIVLCMAAIEQDTLRRLSPGSGRNPCSVHLIHMKLWDPTQLLHFLSLNKQLKWALFYVTGWNTSQCTSHPQPSKWTWWFNQPIFLNSVSCPWVGMSPPGPVESFWGDWYAIWERELFFFLKQSKERDSSWDCLVPIPTYYKCEGLFSYMSQ